MTGATFDDVDTHGMLQELYSSDIQYLEHVKSSFWNFIRAAASGEVNLDGKGWNCPVQLQINESFAAINDGERLPDPDFQKGVYAKWKAKLAYSAIEMTTFAATRGHKGGRPNGKFLEDTIKGTLLSFMSNLDFDALGNGRGFRATVLAATAAASSFTVDFSTRLRPGMKLDWYDSTLATKRGTIKVDIKGVDRLAKTVYVDSSYGSGAVPTGAATDDVLVVAGALAANEPSDGRHAAGYDRLTDNTVSIGNLSPATYAAWQATVLNAAGANPNQEILQQLHDSIYIVASEYANKMAFSPHWKRSYLSGFLGQRQFTSNSFDTGASNLSWSAVRMGKDEGGKTAPQLQMLEDKNMDPTALYMWVDGALCKASDYSSSPHLADEDGAEFRMRQNYDSMHGFYRFWYNLVVKKRSALGKIYGFASPSGVI